MQHTTCTDLADRQGQRRPGIGVVCVCALHDTQLKGLALPRTEHLKTNCPSFPPCEQPAELAQLLAELPLGPATWHAATGLHHKGQACLTPSATTWRAVPPSSPDQPPTAAGVLDAPQQALCTLLQLSLTARRTLDLERHEVHLQTSPDTSHSKDDGHTTGKQFAVEAAVVPWTQKVSPAACSYTQAATHIIAAQDSFTCAAPQCLQAAVMPLSTAAVLQMYRADQCVTQAPSAPLHSPHPRQLCHPAPIHHEAHSSRA